MSDPRTKTLSELLADLERVREQAQELSAQALSPLEEELREQLEPGGHKKNEAGSGTDEA